jgi:TolB-like protein
MKWRLFFLFLLFGNVFLFSQITLDLAISEAAKELDTRLEPGTVVAMVNFNTDSENMANYVLEEIHKNLVKTNILRVVERRQVDLLIEEHNFQMSGYVSDETIQGIGHMLGAESIINGSIELIGRVYRFRIQAINVQTAQMQASYSVNVENDKTTAELMGGKANLTGLSDYTPLERSGAFLLNLIPFGSIGSWFMEDYFGGILGLGIQVVGLGMTVCGSLWEKTPPPDAPDDYYEITTGGTVLLVTGLGILAGGYIFNLVRPYHVNKETRKTANVSIANLGTGFIPGGNKVLLSYKMRF